MFTNMQTLRLTTLAAALTCAFGPALAQDESVTQLTQPNSWFSVGAGWWSNDRPQEGIYDGMNQEGFYGLFDAFINKRDNATGTWYSLDVRNLGLDTRDIRADWLRQGNIGAFVQFSQTPRDNPYTFNTGLRGIGTTTQVVSGTGANALPFGNYHLGTRRDLWNVGGFKNLIPGLDLKVNYKHEEKTGNRQWGRGGAPEFAVEPIDMTTQQAEVLLNYMRDKLQLSGGWYGSWWNQNTSGLVDTSVNGGPPAQRFLLSLPLDNQAQQFFLNGGYNFTPTTRGTFKLSYTHATQNESLPTQSIPGLSLAGTPQSLDGEINTTLAQLGVTSRPTANFSWLANLRYYNAEEETPQNRWVQTGALPCGTGSSIIPPGTAGATCVDNTPLGFETWSGKVEGTYRLPQGFSLIGGIDYADQDRIVPVGVATVGAGGVDRQRYVPFKSSLEETTYRLQVRRGLSETINGSLAYLYSRRSGSGYTLTNEPESDEINPIHVAKRDRNRWRLMLDWTPIEALSLTFNYENAQDKYDTTSDRPYALTKGTGQLFSFDASYAISDLWKVNAWYSWDNQKAEQFTQRAANSGAAAAEKNSDLEDTGNTLGLGLRGVVMPKVRVGADVLYAKQNSKYPETITLLGPGAVFPTAAGVTVAPLQEIENRLTRFKVFAGYELHKNAELFIDYIWEEWKTDDWSWTFANGSPFTYGTTTDGTQVTQAPKQSSNFIGVRYIYKFQ
jgi:MtrB/PioB family decaheme-associated outer membrane protein